MIIKETTVRSHQVIKQLVELWEYSVRITHTFLSEREILNIKNYVPQALKSVDHLILAGENSRNILAFMGISNHKLEMLFVSPKERYKGIGTKLINYGIDNYQLNELTVNEQNPAAKGFYEHMKFKVYKRTSLDEQGASYPLLYMKRNNN